MRVVTAQEMARADRRASQEWGIPTLLMLEHGGVGVA
jgi:hypothetical protein